MNSNLMQRKAVHDFDGEVMTLVTLMVFWFGLNQNSLADQAVEVGSATKILLLGPQV